MTKDKALRMAIKVLEGLCETFMPHDQWEGVKAHDITINAIDACKYALKNPDKEKQFKEPQFAYAWLNKNEGSITLEYEPAQGIIEDSEYKYLGRIKIEVNND